MDGTSILTRYVTIIAAVPLNLSITMLKMNIASFVLEYSSATITKSEKNATKLVKPVRHFRLPCFTTIVFVKYTAKSCVNGRTETVMILVCS